MKALASVPLRPPGFETETLTVPAAAWAGVVAVICVPVVLTVTPVAVAVPKVTVAPDWKLEPIIVTEVPPIVGPRFGEILVIAGREDV